jgi:hypothetical protein
MREKHVCSTITIEIKEEILLINIITLFAPDTNVPHRIVNTLTTK